MSRSSTQEEWSKKIAELSVDALVTAGVVQEADFEKAVEIVAEEVLVRVAMNDLPPSGKRGCGGDDV